MKMYPMTQHKKIGALFNARVDDSIPDNTHCLQRKGNHYQKLPSDETVDSEGEKELDKNMLQKKQNRNVVP